MTTPAPGRSANATNPPSFDDVPMPCPMLLTDEQAAAYWNVSLRTFCTLQLEPWFPRPVLLGPRMRRHIKAELDAATAQMPRQVERTQPESLLRSRIERLKGASRNLTDAHPT